MELYLNGSLIKSLRVQNNLTQAELANKAGVSKSTIVKIETNQIHDIKLSAANKLANFFNLKVEDLYIEKDDVNIDELMLEFLDTIKRLKKNSIDDRMLIIKRLQDFHKQLGDYLRESAL